MFVDSVKVFFVAGRGGDGIVAWHRERCVAKGGPCGGNGNRGGDITIVADAQMPSLDWFRNRRRIVAENGKPGGPNNRQGRRGLDREIRVPCGTIIKDVNTGEVLVDFVEDGQSWVACHGGRGGRGNRSFATPTNRAPRQCTLGKEGESREISFELKIIADVGLVGFPNAGKSTFICSVTKSKAKAASYPFTTLKPNVGFIEYDDNSRVLVADVPGIIDGAAENRGLGHEFLRHIERTKVLVYILDASGIDGRDPWDDYVVLQQELKKYNPALLEKPYAVALNKIDVAEALLFAEEFQEKYPHDPSTLFMMSASEGDGVSALAAYIKKAVDIAKKEEVQPFS